MFSIRRFSLPKEIKQRDWKPYAFDISVAVIFFVLMVSVASVLPRPPKLSTLLIGLLFILLWLVHRRRIISTITGVCIGCIVIDFLLVPPTYTFAVQDKEDGWQLLLIPLFVLLLCLSYSHLKRRADRIKRQKEAEIQHYEEQLRLQHEEVDRHTHQINAYYDVIHATREEQELQAKLGVIARTIEDIFACCGVQKCTFHLPGFDDRLFLRRYIGETNYVAELSTSEEDSAEWVMKHALPVVVADLPLIPSDKGNYLRRVVASSGARRPQTYLFSYLVPLIAYHNTLAELHQGEGKQKVLGVVRLLIEDVAHPELSAIKRRLEMGGETSSAQPELFSQLLDHATSLVEHALIEEVFAQRETITRELQRQTEELHTAIISSVSHDFKMPLTLIKGVATSLLDQGGEIRNEPAYRQMLIDVVSETNWLERVVERMLDLSRIEQNVLRLEKELYPIEAVIQNALDLGHMRSLIQERDITLCVPENLPPVELDPVLIGQVLVNLIENAIRYTPAGSPIEISVRAAREALIVQVADRGAGVYEDELPHIFDSFYRGKQRGDGVAPAQPGQGSGLGLAVCKGYVNAHGGTIWAENRQDGGAVFQFTLPLS